MPAKVPAEGTGVDINKLIPQGHRDFVDKTLADLGVPPLPDDEKRSEGVLGWLYSVARRHRAPPHLHRQTGVAADEPLDRCVARPDAPEPLPMPVQNIMVSEAHQRMNEIRPEAEIITELVSGFEEATRRLDEIAGR